MIPDVQSYQGVSLDIKKSVMTTLSKKLRLKLPLILEANRIDLSKMEPNERKTDRLMINDNRMRAICAAIDHLVMRCPDLVGRVLETKFLHNHLTLVKETVPLGVVGIIYETRPNVTIDAFIHTFLSGNGCVLKGGKEALHTNTCFINIIHECLQDHGLDPKGVVLLYGGRDDVLNMCHAYGKIDVIIPRGGQELITFVRENSVIPVIETGAGVVHCYVDESADIGMATQLIYNSKARRTSVCNALDTLVIHVSLLNQLPVLLQPLSDLGCVFLCDQDSLSYVKNGHPLITHGIEHLSLALSICTAQNLGQAIDYIQTYTSHHSEMIVTSSIESADYFMTHIDAACVYHNASTAFSDGGEFDLGGEIGISTQKMHVRGPFGMESLLSYKWKIYGHGHTRI